MDAFNFVPLFSSSDASRTGEMFWLPLKPLPGFHSWCARRGHVIGTRSYRQKGALPRTKLCPALCANPFVACGCVCLGCVLRERREEESLVSEWVCDGKEPSARSILIGEEREPRSLGVEEEWRKKEQSHEPGRVPRSGLNGLPQ